MEQLNPVEIFNSHWLEAQTFYIRGAQLVYVTTSTVDARFCRVSDAQHLILDEKVQTSEPLFDNAVQRSLTTEKTLKKISLFGDHRSRDGQSLCTRNFYRMINIFWCWKYNTAVTRIYQGSLTRFFIQNSWWTTSSLTIVEMSSCLATRWMVTNVPEMIFLGPTMT